jgi:cytochrome c2
MRAVTFVAVLATIGAGEARAQDAAAGEKVFGVCKACHQIGENAKNAVGPVLNGVISRKQAALPDIHIPMPTRIRGLPGTTPRSEKISGIQK